ncbi:RNA-binding protein [Hellea balneolensis]|uniref:RNA-binding protein n=1 Tax=Hellea balneolensis TaxID=287478 RepID=UPI0003FD4C0D|nr:RNA-binding protein [Hellea balneolensis]
MTIAPTISPDEAEFGPDRRGHKPLERRCLASGESRDPVDMVRFVLNPEGVVTPDIQGKLPGRGAWVSSDRQSLEKVIAQKGFNRGFKGAAKIEGDLAALTERLLSRRVLGLITMARKASVIAMGFDQVQSMAREAAIALRIEASDGSKDGRSKIRTLAKAMNREQELPDPIVVGCFTADDIGCALGRESIVHAAIRPGKLAKSMKIDVRRLSGFRDLVPMNWPDRAHEIREK